MATEVLRPQDSLIARIRVAPKACSRRRYGNGSFNPSYCYNNNNNNNNSGNGRFNRKPVQRRRVRSEQAISKRSSSVDDLKTVGSNFKMEKVTILRRGESLDSNIKSNNGRGGGRVYNGGGGGRELDRLVVTGTDRLGPDPEMVSKQIKSPVIGKSDVYAGSAFAVSPEPSSLPLPSFSKKKQVSMDDSATRDLRRLLRLDI